MTYVSTGRSHAKWRRGKFYQVIPVCHLPVFDGSLDGEDPPSASCFIPNIGILLSHPHHDCVLFTELSERKGKGWKAHLQSVWDDQQRWETQLAVHHHLQNLMIGVVRRRGQQSITRSVRITCFHHIFTTIKYNVTKLLLRHLASFCYFKNKIVSSCAFRKFGKQPLGEQGIVIFATEGLSCSLPRKENEEKEREGRRLDINAKKLDLEVE